MTYTIGNTGGFKGPIGPLATAPTSEAYERLQEAQARHKADSAILDAKPVLDVIRLINTPVTDLRAARATLELSQAQMAEALGADAPRISGWENGKPLPAYIDLAVRCLLAQVAK